MKRINKTAAVLLTGIFLLAAGSGYAQKPGKGMGRMDDAPSMNQNCEMMIPDLTEEQQTQIQDLRLKLMKDMMDYKNQLNEKRAKLGTMQTQENPDMDAINKMIEEMGKLRTEMHKQKAKHHQEVRSLLNEEQKVFFDSHKMMGNKRGMHHKGRPARDGQRPGRGWDN